MASVELIRRRPEGDRAFADDAGRAAANTSPKSIAKFSGGHGIRAWHHAALSAPDSKELLTLALAISPAHSQNGTNGSGKLIAAVLKGDAASFEPLVQKYSPRVFATARRYARRESEVEDIAQEVWLEGVFQAWQSFRRRGAVRALAHADDGAYLLRFFARTPAVNRESSFSELSAAGE